MQGPNPVLGAGQGGLALSSDILRVPKEEGEFSGLCHHRKVEGRLVLWGKEAVLLQQSEVVQVQVQAGEDGGASAAGVQEGSCFNPETHGRYWGDRVDR